MAGLNKVMIIGRLGQDPELKTTGSGASVCTLSVATSESWIDKDGNKQEKTEWHRCVTWNKQADNCVKYLRKGSQVYIEGSLQTREWETPEGEKKSTKEINVKLVQFLSKSEEKEDAPSYAPQNEEVPF